MTPRLLATLGIVATLAFAPAARPQPAPATDSAAPQAKSSSVVRYAQDALTVHATEMPPSEVLEQIVRQAGGAKLTGTLTNDQPVTADFDAIPLKDALERLLGAQNFTLTYAEDGALKAIQLGGTQQDGPAGTDTAGAAPPQSDAQLALYQAFDTRDLVPIEGPIAKRLGKSEAPWDLLTNTSFADDDPAVRRSAVRAGVQAVEANETLRQAVVASTGAMSDGELAAWARATMYHRADDFVRNVSRETSLPDFRLRASRVLRELRKIPFEGPIPTEGSRGRPEGE